jgi:hypothetical protein
MREVERRYSSPIRPLLERLYGSEGSVQGVAAVLSTDDLSISHQTVWRWMRSLGLPMAEPPASRRSPSDPRDEAAEVAG